MSGSVAATIQGEAGSDPANQFAVASTIFNRMQAGSFPGGSDPNAIVNAPSQYVGSASPNATATLFANAIQDGTLGNYGNTGNATFFQTAGSQTTLGSNSPGVVNIGGNNFSDQFGSPSSGFQAPVYTGNIVSASQNTAAVGDNGITINAPSDFTDPGAGGSTDSGAGTAAANDGGATGGSGLLGNIIQGFASAGTGGSIGYSAQPTTSIPTAVTSGFNALANQLGATTSGFMSGIENWLGRGFVMVLAIVVAAIGLWMLAGRPTPAEAVKAV